MIKKLWADFKSQVFKLKAHWGPYKQAWKEGDNTSSHKLGQWTNRWVESARASPYISGHIDAIEKPLFVLGWLLLIAPFWIALIVVIILMLMISRI